MNSSKSSFYSGTSGLVLPISKLLYPAEFQGKSRLTYYASLFNSIEINSSFYKMPMKTTVSKWAAMVPDNFKFTFKLPKTITHVKELAFNSQDIDDFIQTIAHIGHKKGCLLVQLPPALKIDMSPQLEKLLTCIHTADPERHWKLAIEFRHPSWYQENISDLLIRFGACMVIQDLPRSLTPIDASPGSFKYVRFHGSGGTYRGSYPDKILQEYAHHINAWRDEGKIVYIYFNNTMGDAYKNLQTLNRLLDFN